ncbi:pectinesterase inhibitor-like [Lycium barbarum]|uniref:pectinesterase inhibitor-like n=1 Tax=Lycium barbarum TaxID=112863 RepID=UPI00293E38AE|nr:pectinesterase inhibitor-like [Lycium barbarum]
MISMKTLIVIFFIFLSLVTFSSGDLIDDVCRTSANFKVCVSALRADPKSSSADKRGLVRILIQQCLTKGKSIYNEIVSLLKQTKEPVLKEALKSCKENYDGAIDGATSSIKHFDANDGYMTKISASAVYSLPATCEDSFTELHRKSPIKSKSGDMLKLVGLTLSLLDQSKN